MTAIADAPDQLTRYNPFLNPAEADNILGCVMLLMMVANRISLANLALGQARSLLKMLYSLERGKASHPERLKMEMLSLADTLASTLAGKRYYVDQASPGYYDIDPRFLLFEYCHGLLLRNSQVQLVRKLMDDMNAGRSVCHQMIMGAGKTTVSLFILLLN